MFNPTDNTDIEAFWDTIQERLDGASWNWNDMATEWDDWLDRYWPEPDPDPQPTPIPEAAPLPGPTPIPDADPDSTPTADPTSGPPFEPSIPAPEPTFQLLESYTSGLGSNGVESNFNITVEFLGEWTAGLQSAFITASDYLSSLIVGDVQDLTAADGSVIDDIVITAELLDLDGQGGVLGQAGPTELRGQTSSDAFLPSKGVMSFDEADAEGLNQSDGFTNVVVHEMMHTLGFGTLWDFFGLTSGSIAQDTLAFTGDNALAAYIAELDSQGQDTSGIFDVPLETDGGPGTAGGHWDEEVFTDELMTGFLDDGATMSGLSVASLEDMGYDTVFTLGNPGAAMPQVDDFLFA
ncbi:leishmanolysin-related zinc metalloendopeptidase [Gymnodinialimonas sp. 2305UL16-5]|uniref:leishmanolysin-related zinc metalloendopeptidase n=1 Tax=Gymnodinialimonas mytili TaxID=3126503 RepID=UPI0030AAEBE2